ncbi:hypothetical protein [Roseomonas genomospecies 6]|uniref:hypothetical protein n=1 Tax=Roseomonas genomospecies 6 TaxID=214106 RepID=UPI0011F182C1|nr:hypothetical protein [Roseomonas genomospecies 6]
MAQASGIPGLDDRLNRIFQMLFSDNEHEQRAAARSLVDHVRRNRVAPGDLQIVTEGDAFGQMIAELRSRQDTIDRLRSEVLTLRQPTARAKKRGKSKTVTVGEVEWATLLERVHPNARRRAGEIAALLTISPATARRMVKSRTIKPSQLAALQAIPPYSERHPIRPPRFREAGDNGSRHPQSAGAPPSLEPAGTGDAAV